MKPIDPRILVRIANVFGRVLYYPENALGRGLCAFAGINSFTEDQLKALYGVGFRIEEAKQPPPKLPDFSSLDTYAESQEKTPQAKA